MRIATGTLDGKARGVAGGRSLPGIYMELAKFRLSLLVVMTAAAGFVLASHGGVDAARLAWTSLGVALAACGANALNQVQEIARDALMTRTRGRPLPSGRIGRRHALVAALVWATAGVTLLAVRVNLVAAGLTLANVLLYNLVYTPLKTRSTACTLVGALCGALPPLIGWAAVDGRLALGGWILAAVLFVWQIPHFLALAWLYRGDYERGGFRMLPVVDQSGRITVRLLVLYALLLLPLGLAAGVTGMGGRLFAVGSLLLGAWLVGTGVRLWRERSDGRARTVFFASLVYLPLLLGLMIADAAPRRDPAPLYLAPHGAVKAAALAPATAVRPPAPAAAVSAAPRAES